MQGERVIGASWILAPRLPMAADLFRERDKKLAPPQAAFIYGIRRRARVIRDWPDLFVADQVGIVRALFLEANRL